MLKHADILVQLLDLFVEHCNTMQLHLRKQTPSTPDFWASDGRISG